MSKTHLILITDAWYPQVNGVVTTYKNLLEHLPNSYTVTVIHPGLFKSVPVPFYKEVALSLCSNKKMLQVLKNAINNDLVRVHIATEGPLGFQAKRVLDKLGQKYTTAYHTKFPEFIQKMTGIPCSWTRWYFDWFHSKSKVVMVSSESNKKELNYSNARVLGKGYDKHFYFADKQRSNTITLLFVGRVSKEKNIDAFCDLLLPKIAVKKIVVGNGPDKKRLKKKYPDIEFVGYKFGKELASYYQRADVMVFPSKTDTYGIVVLESMACGTPVAAYPVTGPIDQIIEGKNGSVSYDLNKAVLNCFDLDRKVVADTVKYITWAEATKQFLTYLET